MSIEKIDKLICRKIRDSKGNVYAFEMPPDVNADLIEDILLTGESGITKLVAYKLDGDVYRRLSGEAVGAAAGAYNHPKWKWLELKSPKANPNNLSQEEFGTLMTAIIERSKEERINRPRLVEWTGMRVLQDANGYYVEKELPCIAEGCDHTIKGSHRLSRDLHTGEISRAQIFKPYDKNATRSKANSSKWLCADCSPRSIPIHPPQVEMAPETKFEALAPETEEAPVKLETIKEKATRRKSIYDTLEELSKPGADTDPLYLKGFVFAFTQMRTEVK